MMQKTFCDICENKVIGGPKRIEICTNTYNRGGFIKFPDVCEDCFKAVMDLINSRKPKVLKNGR